MLSSSVVAARFVVVAYREKPPYSPAVHALLQVTVPYRSMRLFPEKEGPESVADPVVYKAAPESAVLLLKLMPSILITQKNE